MSEASFFLTERSALPQRCRLIFDFRRPGSFSEPFSGRQAGFADWIVRPECIFRAGEENTCPYSGNVC